MHSNEYHLLYMLLAWSPGGRDLRSEAFPIDFFHHGHTDHAITKSHHASRVKSDERTDLRMTLRDREIT